MAKKTKGKKVEVKKSEQDDSKNQKNRKIIDEKLAPAGEDHFPVLMGFVAFVFLLAAVGVVGYFFLYDKGLGENLQSNNDFEITLPESDEQPEDDSDEAIVTEEEEEGAETEEQPEVERQRLQVTETPTDFLNVRTGPSTNFEIVTQVNPGDIFEILQYNSEVGWYQIQLDEERTGWVTEVYVEVL